MKKYLRRHFLLLSITILYVLVRLLLLNLNATEWGDSFKMMRASEILLQYNWPVSEKRWPLYWFLLLPGINYNIPVLWGKIMSLISSVGILIYTYLFYLRFFSKEKIYALFASIVVMTTPVIAYWGLRAMVDIVFGFTVIAFLYHFLSMYSAKYESTWWKELILSFLLAIVALGRFEGGFLVFGVYLFLILKGYFKKIVLYSVPLLILYLPWLIWVFVFFEGGDSAHDNYLKELSAMKYDWTDIEQYIAYTSLILVAPIFTSFYLLQIVNELRSRILNFLPLLSFFILEIIMGFIWIPSLPRIYLSIVPIVAIFAVYYLERYRGRLKQTLFICFVTALATMYLYYFQNGNNFAFLTSAGRLVAVACFITFIIVLLIVFKIKYYKYYIIVGAIIINLMTTVKVIYEQKDVYKTEIESIQYLLSLNNNSKIGVATETGNATWFFRGRIYTQPFWHYFESVDDQYNVLKENGVEYIIVSNEYNRASNFIDPKNSNKYRLLFESRNRQKTLTNLLKDILSVKYTNKNFEFYSKVYELE